jgi:hypothetical protein
MVLMAFIYVFVRGAIPDTRTAYDVTLEVSGVLVKVTFLEWKADFTCFGQRLSAVGSEHASPKPSGLSWS